MVWEILATAPFGKEKKGEVGVERLADEGAYTAAFPLHDVSGNGDMEPLALNIGHDNLGAFTGVELG